jgi:DNA-binding MarR family transcriptional regulator
MAASSARSPSACPYVLGEDGLSHWSPTHSEAWIGLLQTHRQLTRELDAELECEHGLSLSGVELLGRLAAAEGRALRLSTLADQARLSLSRVSRILDLLEARELVERRPCDGDGRGKNAWLTNAGLELLRAAQATHFAGVQRRFFDHLDADEIVALAAIFAHFGPGAAATCT